jgi:hypothetical protein
MKLTRTAAADSTKHRDIERLTDNEERELGRRYSRILNHQFASLSQPSKCGGQDIDRSAWPALVILAGEVWKPSCFAQNQLAATQQFGIHHDIDVAPGQLLERRWHRLRHRHPFA